MSLPTDETPTRRVRLTAAQREAQLLDIAEALFTEHGFEGVTVEDIARAAGVSRPIVYQHLGTKEGAFVACVRRAREQFEKSIEANMNPAVDNWTDCIRTAGYVYFDLISFSPQRWSLLFTTSASLEGRLADQLTSLRAETAKVIAASIRPYAPTAPAEAVQAVAQVVSGIGEQLGRWWLANPSLPRERVVSYYVMSIEGAALAILELPPGQKSAL